MKVKIGKYVNYFNCYHLAELLCFWVPKVPDPDLGEEFPVFPDWVYRFGEILDTGSFKKGAKSESWLSKFFEWWYNKRQRTIKVHIDEWDTWSMDCTLAYIIVPMLKQLKETQHGVPARDFGETDDNGDYVDIKEAEKNWNATIDKMIWSFNELIEEKPNEPEPIYKDPEPEADACITEWIGREILNWDEYVEQRKEYEERLQEGFNLFGKYYRSLWD